MNIFMIGMFCGGCAVDSHAIRDDSHEQELLSTSADLFWEGIRWGDAEKAASFIEPEDRALFQVRLEEKLEHRRVVEYTILQTTISPMLDAPNSSEDPWRTGTVSLVAESYTMPAQILSKDEIEQHWHRTPTGWWLNADEVLQSME